MENDKKKFALAKKIAQTTIGLLTWVILIFLTDIIYFEPLFKDIDYKLSNSLKAVEEFPKAAKGDQESIARLERLSHKNLSVAYLMLDSIYRTDALKAAGVDMNDPNASFDSVDLSKSRDLILRAVDEIGDFELLLLLQSAEVQFDDSKRDTMLAGVDDLGTGEIIKNQIKFSAKSAFDQATRERLKSCKARLDEKFSNRIMLLVYFRDYGFCTDTPPDGSFKRMLELRRGADSLSSTDVEEGSRP